MKALLTSALIGLTGTAALADLVSKPSGKSVVETMDALEAAVSGAGATVFARVDHGAGAASVDLEMPEAQLLIFGNPRLGTPIMNMDIKAGLQLPLRVLVHETADGTVAVSYETADTLLDGLGVDLGAEVIGRMNGALNMLTDKAIAE
ncbi:MAG: DUF302 domain-containing protein [Pseudomonadota bacterium]